MKTDRYGLCPKKGSFMLHELDFLSFNDRDRVYGWIYVPACRPLGIIQLIHGFGEHSRRYLHMITSFMEAGYIVATDDHIGHGKTALENDSWGNWLTDTGHNVTTVLYTGYRHEIHNYSDIKEEVEDGIIAFFDSCIM